MSRLSNFMLETGVVEEILPASTLVMSAFVPHFTVTLSKASPLSTDIISRITVKTAWPTCGLKGDENL